MMKIMIAALFAALSVAAGGSVSGADKLQLSAGLPPVGWIVSQIGGEHVDAMTVLPEGRTPHEYSPKPQALKKMYQTRVFFSAGMPFEKKIEDSLKNTLSVVDVGKKIQFRKMDEVGECEHEEHAYHHHHDGENDPHFWLSPVNAVKIGEVVCRELVRRDPDHAGYYQQKFNAFRERMMQLDAVIARELAPYSGRGFFVYHPSFGYFADAYKLRQHGIELNGREATAAQIAKVLKMAREEKVSVIFVQPQFNPNSAASIARRLGGEVAALDPLAADLHENLAAISRTLQKGFAQGGRR